MLEVGLTAVADHPTLAANGKTSSLKDLAQYFPIMEMDTGFYRIPSPQTVLNWQAQVPSGMRFIIKASQWMTLHKQDPEVDVADQFNQLRDAVAPLIQSQQLVALMFQMPPWFAVTATNVRYFQRVRRLYPDLPVAVEFRHDSWYLPEYRQSTLSLLKQLHFIHIAVDEPQTPAGSVPLVPVATNPDWSILRLHGRNYAGWQANQMPGRTSYRYLDSELLELADVAKQFQSQYTAVIFNNNGQGDAADNALRFIAQQHLDYRGLAPQQTTLF